MKEQKLDDETTFSVNNSVMLGASIVIASIILSVTLFFAAGSLSGGLDKVAASFKGAPTVGLAPLAIPSPSPAPTPAALAPSGGTVQMAEAVKDAAAKRGNENAKVVIVEYSDYQCPFCRRFYDDAYAQIKKEYVDTGKALFVYKDFPLPFHPQAEPLAESARCAGDQQKYWEMHDKIFIEQGKQGQGTITTTVDDIKKWAGEIGLNTATFNSCLDSGKYKSIIQTSISEGSAQGVSGTPSFLIGKPDGTGQLVVGAQPFGAFKAVIDPLLQ